MKLIIQFLFLVSCLPALGQSDKYVGEYRAYAQTDSMYGLPLDSTIHMEVILKLNPDSTYTISNHFHFVGGWGFDYSQWFNAGYWTAHKDLIFFTTSLRNKKDQSQFDYDLNEYPIEHLMQPYSRSKGEIKATMKAEEHLLQRWPNLRAVHVLRADENGILDCTYSWDCFEYIWKTRRIEKVN